MRILIHTRYFTGSYTQGFQIEKFTVTTQLLSTQGLRIGVFTYCCFVVENENDFLKRIDISSLRGKKKLFKTRGLLNKRILGIMLFVIVTLVRS